MEKNKEPKEPSMISSVLYSIWLFAIFITSPVTIPLMYIIWPFLASIILKRTKYIRHYPHYVKRGFQNLWEIHRHGALWKTFKINYAWSRGHKENLLNKRKGDCVQCGNCCRSLKCALVEKDKKTNKWVCSFHDHAVWAASGCSKFPLTPEDIDKYNCQGFWFEE